MQITHEEEPQKKDRISRASLKFDPNDDDYDPRFLNTLSSSEGADLKRKFFKNTTPDYLMTKCKNLEQYNKDMFMEFIKMGSVMIDLATKGDLDTFKRLFAEAMDKEIMFWHITKAFKAAVKHKQLLIIEFIVEDLDTPINHEAFEGMLHFFIFQCQEAEQAKDEVQIEVNR